MISEWRCGKGVTLKSQAWLFLVRTTGHQVIQNTEQNLGSNYRRSSIHQYFGDLKTQTHPKWVSFLFHLQSARIKCGEGC